jgi:hypothetical protein
MPSFSRTFCPCQATSQNANGKKSGKTSGWLELNFHRSDACTRLGKPVTVDGNGGPEWSQVPNILQK